ncbi:hypothetical protein [Commensalibacter sp. Nvir]|uniref:hypothetical protein n=1 Tax=Commensalibacter sp. Nvir TaxID=3069817 RepID=UPI0030C8065D
MGESLKHPLGLNRAICNTEPSAEQPIALHSGMVMGWAEQFSTSPCQKQSFCNVPISIKGFFGESLKPPLGLNRTIRNAEPRAKQSITLHSGMLMGWAKRSSLFFILS